MKIVFSFLLFFSSSLHHPALAQPTPPNEQNEITPHTVDDSCNHSLKNRFKQVARQKVEDEVKLNQEAEMLAKSMINKTADAINKGTMNAIEAVNKEIILTYSMDTSKFATIIGNSTVESLTKLKVVQQEGINLVEKTKSFDRNLKILIPEMKSGAENFKDGDFLAKVPYVGNFLKEKWNQVVQPRLQGSFDRNLKIEEVFDNMTKAVETFTIKSDELLKEINDSTIEIKAKGRNLRAIIIALSSTLGELEEFISETEQSPDTENKNNELSFYRNYYAAILTQLEMTKEIYLENALNLTKLHTVFNKVQIASYIMTSKGLRGISVAKSSFAFIKMAEFVADVNNTSKSIIEIAEESNNVLINALISAEKSEIDLRDYAAYVAKNLGVKAKSLQKFTQNMSVSNDKQFQKTINDEKNTIIMLDKVIKKVDEHNKDLSTRKSIDETSLLPTPTSNQ